MISLQLQLKNNVSDYTTASTTSSFGIRPLIINLEEYNSAGEASTLRAMSYFRNNRDGNTAVKVKKHNIVLTEPKGILSIEPVVTNELVFKKYDDTIRDLQEFGCVRFICKDTSMFSKMLDSLYYFINGVPNYVVNFDITAIPSGFLSNCGGLIITVDLVDLPYACAIMDSKRSTGFGAKVGVHLEVGNSYITFVDLQVIVSKHRINIDTIDGEVIPVVAFNRQHIDHIVDQTTKTIACINSYKTSAENPTKKQQKQKAGPVAQSYYTGSLDTFNYMSGSYTNKW